MLASWMRMKYPHIVDGVIAASAPIWAFPGENPPVDSNAFAKTVTRDATPAGGASEACAGSDLVSRELQKDRTPLSNPLSSTPMEGLYMLTQLSLLHTPHYTLSSPLTPPPFHYAPPTVPPDCC